MSFRKNANREASVYESLEKFSRCEQCGGEKFQAALPSLSQSKPSGCSEASYQKSRAELLTERKNKLIEIADSAPDALVVYACLIYLRAYFGSGSRVIREVIKSNLHWRIQTLSIIWELNLERFYYLFVKGFSERDWQARLDAEIEDFNGENES